MSNGSAPLASPATLCGLMKDAILQLCRSNVIYRGCVEVDGIICISGSQQGQQLVIKLHEKLGHSPDCKDCNDKDDSPDYRHSPDYSGATYREKQINGDHNGSPAKRLKLSPVRDKSSDKLSPLRQNGDHSGNHSLRSADHSPQSIDDKDDDSGSDGEAGKDILDLTNRTAVDLSQDGSAAWPFYSESRLRSLLTKGVVGRSHGLLPFFGRRLPYNMPPMIQPPSPECKTCGIVIYDPEMLREHNETQHGVFTCGICYRTFTSRSNLERHSRLHTGHKPYICGKCGKAFSRKDHLTNHSAKHAFKCSKCLKRFVEKENLRQHYSRDHHITMTDVCLHCNKGFHDAHQYREHMKSHPETYQKRGPLAPYDPDSKHRRDGSLTPPMTGTSPSPKLSPTSLASSSPPSPNADPPKNFKHRQPHYYKYQCNECHMMYSNAEDLEQHKKHLHSGFTCMACYETFTNPHEYSLHFGNHKEERNIFECATCRQIVQTYAGLRNHEEIHVTEIKPKEDEEIDVVTDESATYLCPYCAKSFPTESLLMEHVSIHEGLQQHSYMPVDGYPADSYTPSYTPAYSIGDSVEKSMANADITGSIPSVVGVAIKTERVSPRKSPSPSKVRVEEASSSEEPVIMVTRTLPSVVEVDGRDAREIREIRERDSHLRDRDPREVREREAVDYKMEVEDASPVSAGDDSMDGVSHWVSIKNHKYSYNVPVPEISFVCSICNCHMPNFKEYESHCFAAHYRYPCMYCHKTFAQRPNRDRHVCIHTGEKPFDCPDCNLKFSRGDKLKLHRIKVHKLEYPGPYVRLTSASSPTTTSVTSSNQGSAVYPST